jgi:putative redox protein
MTVHELSTRYAGGMAFEAEKDGQVVRMDAAEEVGGQNTGFRPKPLLLASLTGCTGMDVVSLLQKMRVNFSDFEMKVKAELGEEHPKQYQSIELEYLVKVSIEDRPKFEKAVNLSQEKYCGVSAMLAKVALIKFVITWL